MYRFTTPKHTFKFPSSIEPVNLAEILITYSQAGNIILERRKDQLTMGENNTVYFQFTQEDSALFRANVRVEVQVRILFATGESYASKKKEVEVLSVLHNGVLEVD